MKASCISLQTRFVGEDRNENTGVAVRWHVLERAIHRDVDTEYWCCVLGTRSCEFTWVYMLCSRTQVCALCLGLPILSGLQNSWFQILQQRKNAGGSDVAPISTYIYIHTNRFLCFFEVYCTGTEYADVLLLVLLHHEMSPVYHGQYNTCSYAKPKLQTKHAVRIYQCRWHEQDKAIVPHWWNFVRLFQLQVVTAHRLAVPTYMIPA